MTLISNYTDLHGNTYTFEYSDADSFDHLDKTKCTQTYGVCFCDGKILLGYSGHRKEYVLIGGTIEEGESFEQTLRREIQEESNMEILSFLPIGYQKVTSAQNDTIKYQLRYACLVKPFGPFISDPFEDIVSLRLVEQNEYKEYLKWESIGNRIMERAIELLPKLG